MFLNQWSCHGVLGLIEKGTSICKSREVGCSCFCYVFCTLCDGICNVSVFYMFKLCTSKEIIFKNEKCNQKDSRAVWHLLYILKWLIILRFVSWLKPCNNLMFVSIFIHSMYKSSFYTCFSGPKLSDLAISNLVCNQHINGHVYFWNKMIYFCR